MWHGLTHTGLLWQRGPPSPLHLAAAKLLCLIG